MICILRQMLLNAPTLSGFESLTAYRKEITASVDDGSCYFWHAVRDSNP